MNVWTVTSRVVLALLLGALGCERGRVDDHGETKTRSGELTSESPPAAKPRPRDEVPIETTDAGELRATREAGAPTAERPRTDPRFDAGRLSIVGSAKERELNLGLVRDPTIGPVEITLPGPQKGAGAVESPPPPARRVGAGRPGAGGDTYQ